MTALTITYRLTCLEEIIPKDTQRLRNYFLGRPPNDSPREITTPSERICGKGVKTIYWKRYLKEEVE